MASNEEILKDLNWSNDSDPGRYALFTGLINPAMDAARKDEAEAFGKWILQSAYHKECCWYLYKDMSGEMYTTEQLYTIFKNRNS